MKRMQVIRVPAKNGDKYVSAISRGDVGLTDKLVEALPLTDEQAQAAVALLNREFTVLACWQ